MKTTMTRRQVLRGTMGGAVLSVGLPFLDCLLNENGTALAATGAPLPTAFGTWYQGLAFNPDRWKPDAVGGDYESKAELKVFDPFRERMNLFSGMNYFLDGRPMETHRTGVQIAWTGGIPIGTDWGASIDSIIADEIGTRTRFRTLDVSPNGNEKSNSRRAGSATPNPSETDPLALYQRIFGTGFADPNAEKFSPDPLVMARKSVLSYVSEDRQTFAKGLGHSDKARLDEYFSAVRQIEQQLVIQLEEPEPLSACSPPGVPGNTEIGKTPEMVEKNNKLFGMLLAHALACGQTRVFNVNIGQNLRRPGSTQNWHTWTHEEPVDSELGYQPEVTWFINFANRQFADFIAELDKIKEGDGTLLDRLLVLWQTDHGYARTHTMEDLPIITIGNAGGRLKTGYHVSAAGDPTTRAGLTVMQAMGVPIGKWGALSNETGKSFTELLG